MHSDTLSAALAAIKAQIGEKEDILNFLSSFKISSAFPFYKDYLFLPKPQGRLPIESKSDINEIRKELKKVRYIELELWKDIVDGKHIDFDQIQLNDEYLIKKVEIGNTYRARVTQRVGVARDGTGKTSPFFFEWKFYSPDSGLYCIIECNDSSFPEIERLFHELGERGLGTDKNIGGGKFEVETSGIELPEIKEATHQMLLSLFIPTNEELDALNLEASKYEILLRGGFMAGSIHDELRHLRKKSVYMFNTGSLFNTTIELNGKIVDLQPEWNDEKMHPVYRSGRAFYIPVKIENYEQY